MRLISIVRTAADRAEHSDCADHNHLDLDPMAQTQRGRTPRSRSHRTAIAARSNRDRGAIEPRSESKRGGIASTMK